MTQQSRITGTASQAARAAAKTSPTTAPAVPHHWVITVSCNGETLTFTDVIDITPEDTRRSIFSGVHQAVLRNNGLTGGSVLFYSLEPNQL